MQDNLQILCGIVGFKFIRLLAGALCVGAAAFAVDVPPPCAPVPVRKAVKVERREIAVSIIGKGLLSRAKCGSAEEMIAYWTAAMDEEIGNKPDLVVLPEISDALSTDPALPVDKALAEFEIENWRDYAVRSAAARKAKLHPAVQP